MNNHRALTTITGIVTGSAAFILGYAVRDGVAGDDMRAVALATFLATLGWVGLRVAARPSHIAYEDGYRHGYQDGEKRGRRAARPVIVAMRKNGSAPLGTAVEETA